MSSDSEDEMQDWRVVSAKVLKRGEKDHAPDGTEGQLSSLQQSRGAMYAALSQMASSSVKNIVECDWITEKRVGKIRKLKGNFFNTMGYVESGNMFLRPEEVIYLVQRGSVVCYLNSDKLSLQGVMALALPSIGTDNLHVYSNLKRLGYVVQRATNPSLSGKPQSVYDVLSMKWHQYTLFPNLSATADSIIWSMFKRYLTKLARKSYYTNYASVYSDLAIIRASEIIHRNTENGLPCPFTFYVWKPSTKFRKSQPPEADFKVVTASAHDPLPNLETIEDIFSNIEPVASRKNSVITRVLEGYRKYTYAVVDNGIVAFVNATQTLFEPCIHEPTM